MELKKSSRITLLRPQILSIALGIAWALLCLLVTLMAMVSGQAGRLVQIFQLVYPGYALTAGGLVIGLIWAYLYVWLLVFLIGYF